MEQKRAWLYCRVGHNGPDSAGVLAAQRDRLENYAKEHGFEIVGSSNDIGSGLTLDRLGLLDFHEAAEGGDADILLTVNISRIGRGVNMVTKYWQLLRALDVSVHTADCGEIDMSIYDMLRREIGEIRRRPV